MNREQIKEYRDKAAALRQRLQDHLDDAAAPREICLQGENEDIPSVRWIDDDERIDQAQAYARARRQDMEADDIRAKERARLAAAVIKSTLPDEDRIWDLLIKMDPVWPSPGGISFLDFAEHIRSATTPPGWPADPLIHSKSEIPSGVRVFTKLVNSDEFGNGPTSPGRCAARSDIGGQLAFEMIEAVLRNDQALFADFAKAANEWHQAQVTATPLWYPVHHKRYVVLCALMEKPQATYRPKDLLAYIKELYPMEVEYWAIDYKDVQRVMSELGVAKP